MDQPVPIPTLHLFPVLNELLVDLLRSLSPEDWNRPTIAKLWTVKDIAAHLLDTNMRAIASRDSYVPPGPAQNIDNYSQLVAYLNELNATWVQAMKRISPQQLIELLESTGKECSIYFSTLDPFATSKYSVAWAGEEQSLNWFDIARVYTEKWHHHQQIRDAVGKTDALMIRQLFYPCIDTFICGLPHAYRDVESDMGSVIQITISSESGGNWYLVKKTNGWVLDKYAHTNTPDALIIIEPDIAWKLFTKAITADLAIARSVTKGNIKLARNVFSLIAVMA